MIVIMSVLHGLILLLTLIEGFYPVAFTYRRRFWSPGAHGLNVFQSAKADRSKIYSVSSVQCFPSFPCAAARLTSVCVCVIV